MVVGNGLIDKPDKGFSLNLSLNASSYIILGLPLVTLVIHYFII
jgi:hypothetical protein